jgi:hypothetical protein
MQYTTQFSLQEPLHRYMKPMVKRGVTPVQMILCAMDSEGPGTAKTTLLDAEPWIRALGGGLSAHICVRLGPAMRAHKQGLYKHWKRYRSEEPASPDGKDLKIVDYRKGGVFRLPWS